MCGIIAYKGNRNVADVVLHGLKKLEYRGYDSWGIAAKGSSKINILKKVGKISEASEAHVKGEKLAIGHTRWATHGGVTEQNAHPHLDCTGKIAVVHNGIVENYQELKKVLASHKFLSQTDTEVIAHLIEEKMHLGFEDAVKAACKIITGRYAIVVISADSDKVIAVRRGSPLVVGIGKDETFIASDIPAFLDYTNKISYLDDNQMVVINDKAEFFDLEKNQRIEKRVIEIDWKPEHAEKGGYEHFLIKEIMEQKDTIRKAVEQPEEKILKVANEIKSARGTFLVGCGTAGKVCFTAEYLFSKIASMHVNFTVASEFPNYHHFLTDKTLMIAVSQSGETADVLEAIETAKSKNVKVISILNVFGSTMMRVSDDFIMVNAGPEQAVVSTKATTAQIAVLTLLAYACAGKLREGKIRLVETGAAVNDMLNPRYEEHIKKLAEKLFRTQNIYIIGRSLNYPIALEAAIKLQETAYIHAEGFAGGELKHGPIALIEEGTPCIAIVANDEAKHDMISNAMEIKARGGYIIGVAPENNEVFDYWIKVPDVRECSPIVNIIPIQMLAYYIATLRGNNPDKPRNLAKSVTVK